MKFPLYLNNILAALLFLFAAYSCRSSKSFLQRGEYNEAVYKSVKKLQKNPSDREEAAVLLDAFNRAQQQDLDRISFLKKEGRPDIWEEIIGHYNAIRHRQELVKTLPALSANGRPVSFSLINWEEGIIDAKQKAAAYLYTHSQSLLGSSHRQDARKAYSELSRLKELYPVYKDTDMLLEQAQKKGTTHILLKVENNSGAPMPPELEEELVNVPVRDLNKKWVRFHTRYVSGQEFHLLVSLKVKNIAVSPERISEKRYEETRKVKDGWEYKLDQKGNVAKDEKGNDIKVDRFKTLRCIIIENCQEKSARIIASAEVINTSAKDIIHASPLVAETFFSHESAFAQGELEALSPESRKKIGRPPVPFPSDVELIMQAAATLKGLFKTSLHENQGLFH